MQLWQGSNRFNGTYVYHLNGLSQKVKKNWEDEILLEAAKSAECNAPYF